MASHDRPPAPRGPNRPAPRVELVTISLDDLEARYEDVANRTAARVASQYERLIERYADRLDAAAAQAGLKEWLTTREAAAYCGLEYDRARGECVTLRRWRSDGLEATRGRGRWMYRPADLDAFRAGLGGGSPRKTVTDPGTS
jgi:hypothetical protein